LTEFLKVELHLLAPTLISFIQARAKALKHRKTPVDKVVASSKKYGKIFFSGFEVDGES